MKYSIIITYRDREKHLSQLLPVLQKKFQDKDYEIIISEQDDNKKFRKNDLYNIIDLELRDLRANLKERNVNLRVSASAKNILLEDGSHIEWGARPIRRIIQNEIESKISLGFLNGTFKDNSLISISASKSKLQFKSNLKKQKNPQKA